MTISFHDRSVVAIDPTPKGIAYVFFENGELLDADQRGTSSDEREILAAVDEIPGRLRRRCPHPRKTRTLPRRAATRAWRHLLRLITSHVRRRNIPVLAVAREDVREAWAAKGVTTKESDRRRNCRALCPASRPSYRRRASILIARMPRVNLFDAASLALFLFAAISRDLAR